MKNVKTVQRKLPIWKTQLNKENLEKYWMDNNLTVNSNVGYKSSENSNYFFTVGEINFKEVKKWKKF